MSDENKTGEESSPPTRLTVVPPVEEQVEAAPPTPPPAETDVQPESTAPVDGEKKPNLTAKQKAALLAQWEQVRERYRRTLHAQGKKPAGLARYVKGGRSFIDWCVERGITPEAVTEEVATEFAVWINAQPVARITKNVDRLAAAGMTKEAMAIKKGEPEEQVQAAEDEQEQEGYEEGETEEGEGEEQPDPPRRQKRAPAAPQVVYVQAPPARGRPPGARDSYQRATPTRTKNSLLPRTEKIRIFKRGLGGKKMFVDDYTVDEIGGSIPKFIRDYIEPDFADPSGYTVYEAYEVDANDREKGSPAVFPMESTPQTQPDPASTPISQLKSAFDLLNEIRGAEGERLGNNREILDDAKKRAVGSGDMNSMLMLMMMERMMGGNNGTTEALALKIAEALKGPAQPQPMFTPPPPPAPAHSPFESMMTKFIEMQMAQAMKPQPTLADQMKEMFAMQQLFGAMGGQRGGNDELAALRAELHALRSANNGQPGSFESMLGHYEKIRTMVKELSPQINVGGITDTIKQFVTPELAKALGNGIASAMSAKQAQVQGVPQPPAQARVQVVQPQGAVPNPIQAQPLPPPPPPAQTEIITAAQALRVAATEEAQLQATYDLIQAMYKDPEYTAQIDAAIQPMLATGDTKPADSYVRQVVTQVRAELGTSDFAEKAVDFTVKQVGGQPLPRQKPEVKADPAPAPTPPVRSGGEAAVEMMVQSARQEQQKVAEVPLAPANGTTVEAQVTAPPPPPAAPPTPTA